MLWSSVFKPPLKKALTEVEKMEDMLFEMNDKAVEGVPAPMQTAWSPVLDAGRAAGTATGTKAAAAVAEVTEQARRALREGRAAGMTAAQALQDSYGALSGFDQGKVEREFFPRGDETPDEFDQEYFPDRHIKTSFICNLGYGDPTKLFPRSPRLDFDDACKLL